MSLEFAEYLPIIVGALVGAIVAILVIQFLSRRSTVVGSDTKTKDVLDEGAAPASRNQALIDAPPVKAAPDPVVTPSAEPIAEPVAEPEPAVPKASVSATDDLTRIKGLGPKIATVLKDQGITSYAQIAAWSEDDIERIDASLGRFAGRITRDQWVIQAKLLSAGDETGFVSQFGQNG
ncbi:MAG: helix-hairpin-helix domain-containing protein [Erythrobacter sp.]